MKNCLLLFSILLCNITFSQQEKTYYAQFDHIVNPKNTSLSYGVLFKEKFRKLRGDHNYYLTNYFLTGNVNYQGEKFTDVIFKYDLVDDQVIVKIPDNDETFIFILENKLVSNFTIKDIAPIKSKSISVKEELVISKLKRELKTTNFINTNSSFGFVEPLTKNKFLSLYKKYKKKAYRKSKENFVHFEFSERVRYLFEYDGEFRFVKSKKDFVKIFPNLKSLISKQFKSKNYIRKKNPDAFYQELVKTINQKLIEIN